MTLPLPLRINLGSGRDFRPDWLNIDHSAFWKPDLILDLNQPFAGLGPLASERFGPVILTRGAFQEILAQDLLEHLPNLVGAMTSCLNLLAVGGILRLKVPYDLSYGAWQDPTHVRAFNEQSFGYYTENFWYLGWTEARFDLTELRFGISPLGRELAEKGLPPEEVLRTPRAIDSMDAVLTKRLLPTEERQHALSFGTRA